MRILHVGSGFRPLRRGGLVAYVEDLIDEQVRRGHDVAYFFSGRYYPFARRARLRRWQTRGTQMFEVVNSPLYDHGRQPELELGEPRVEEMLREVLETVQPDVVHVHELAGLPSSLLDVVRDSGLRCLFTLQDYFPLCSTFKLLDADGNVCLRRQIGVDCVATTAAENPPAGLLVEATVRHELLKRPLARRFDPSPPHRRIMWLARALGRTVTPPRPASPEAFQRRRDVNVERLNRTDRLIAMSTRVKEIYEALGVDPARIETVQLTLAHLERLRPRAATGTTPVNFGTLNGLASAAKGARLLVDAARIVHERAPAGSFRILVYGEVDPGIAAEARALPPLHLRGPYGHDAVDSVLDEIEVGIIPSVWEEAYGYVGLEFLAKGIPVIANAIGGMTDYTRDGETGWLNRSRTAEELARIMIGVIERPDAVARLNARILEARDVIVKPVSRHADEMDSIYADLTG